MRSNRLLTIAVATMLLLAGATAVGAAAPGVAQADDHADGNETAPDAADEGDELTDDGPDAVDAGDDRAGDAAPGPSDGLPEQVPDHVGQIHDRIGSFLSGSNDSLGQSLADLLAGGAGASDAGDGDAADERSSSTEDASETA